MVARPFQLQLFDQRLARYFLQLEGAEILSQHQKLLNLQLPDGMIITLAASEIIPSPRMCQFPTFDPQKVIEDGKFNPARCSFFGGEARDFSVFVPTAMINQDNLSRAWDWLAARPRATGNLLQTALGERIKRFLTQLDTGSTDLRVQVADLIGLGHGLTPTGDDFLAGLVLAAGLPDSHYQDQRLALIAAIKSTLQNTHPLSRAFLLDACERQVNSALQEVISHLYQATANTANAENMQIALNLVATIGHSSGTDMLSGMLTAFPHDTKQREFLCPFTVK